MEKFTPISSMRGQYSNQTDEFCYDKSVDRFSSRVKRKEDEIAEGENSALHTASSRKALPVSGPLRPQRAVQPGCSTQASIASHGYILRFIRILVLCEFYSKENLNYYATAASMVLIGVHDPS